MRSAEMRRALARLLVLVLPLLLAACGGGDSGGGTTSGSGTGTGTTTGGSGTTTPPATLTNFTTITVDGGPAALRTGTTPTIMVNVPYVSVTICAPGTSTCQTIDHVILDTGSVGLRLMRSALNTGLLAALPNQRDASGNAVGECYGFVDGYTFGSVRTADFQIGGASVASMPIDVVADSGAFSTIPASCSSGGGDPILTIGDMGGNGILGIGTTATDCGTACARTGGYGAAIYYDCPAPQCGAIIARAANMTAPFQQLPNPIAALSRDNNGSIIVMPPVAAGGAASTTGTLYFGIETETNNSLSAATVLATSASGSSLGPGFFTANYKGSALPYGFLDSGSSAYFFVDNSLAACTSTNARGYYCPVGTTSLTPTLVGTNGATYGANLSLANAETLFRAGYAALPGLGANPNALSGLTPIAQSFDFGFPFFYGRSVYTAIEGRAVGNLTGPFVAF